MTYKEGDRQAFEAARLERARAAEELVQNLEQALQPTLAKVKENGSWYSLGYSVSVDWRADDTEEVVHIVKRNESGVSSGRLTARGLQIKLGWNEDHSLSIVPFQTKEKSAEKAVVYYAAQYDRLASYREKVRLTEKDCVAWITAQIEKFLAEQPTE